MAGANPAYEWGPIPFEVNQAVVGGQLVEPDAATGRIKPAAAGSAVCLGVACTDAIPAATNQNDNANDTNLSPIGPYVAVASQGYWVLTYAAACTLGTKVKVAANGTVTPWVSGTDAAALVVGICCEAAANTNDKRLTLLSL